MIFVNLSLLIHFLDSVFWLVTVGAIWGCSTPFIKKASKGIEQVKSKNNFTNLIYELKFMFTNWKVI